MDWLSRIVAWLSDHEAGISAVAAIIVISGVILVASACQRRPTAPRLVVLYATCSVNKDYLAPYSPEIRFTKNMESFAGDALVFTRHMTESGQSGIAYASILTGVHADIHGIYRHPLRLGDDVYEISEAYRDAGYETFFWSGHPMASYDLNYGQGVSASNAYVFERFKSFDGLTATTRQFTEILERLEQDPDYKAFVQIFFTVTHSPYHRYATAEVRRRFLEAFPDERPPVDDEDFARLLGIYHAHIWQLSRNFPETVERLGLKDEDVRDLALVLEFVYKAAIHQLDMYFGRFLDSIREAGLFDASMIVLTADHGEILYRENAPFKWTHGLQLAPEVLNVPFMLYAPSQGIHAGRYDKVTRSIDVFPTIAALSGVPIPDGVAMEGVDLSSALRGNAAAPDLIAFSHTSTIGGEVIDYYKKRKLTLALRYFARDDANLSWVSARRGAMVYKLVFDGSEWRNVAFNLATDPVEKHDLYDPGIPEHREMMEKLRSYKIRLVQGSRPDSEPLSPEDIENLRALGYIGGNASRP